MRTMLGGTIVVLVMVVFAVSGLAQKGTPTSTCVDNAPSEYCVKVSGNLYRGYLSVVEDNSNPRIQFDFPDEGIAKLKVGKRYTLTVGFELNQIKFTITNSGQIVLVNTSDLSRVTPGAKKIEIKTVPIKIVPNAYEYYYYLSLFYNPIYDRGSRRCPYYKTRPSPLIGEDAEQTANLCPSDRVSSNDIAVMPNSRYFVEPHASGYGGAIAFSVGAKGDISKISHPFSATAVGNTLVFRNQKVFIRSRDFSGKVMFGEYEIDVTKGGFTPIIMVPYSVAYLSLGGGAYTERTFLTNGTVTLPPTPCEFRLLTKQKTYMEFQLAHNDRFDRCYVERKNEQEQRK